MKHHACQNRLYLLISVTSLLKTFIMAAINLKNGVRWRSNALAAGMVHNLLVVELFV